MATDQGKAPDPLGKLLQGMAAAAQLLNTATEKRSAFEAIVLQSNLIDGTLRVGLVLKFQLDSGTGTIKESFLIPTDSETEKSIYQRCLAEKIIDQSLFKKLSQAHDKWSQCIHRFLLSDIEYDYASNLVFEFDELLESVKAAIGHLEEQQLEKGVGMTRSG